MKRILLFIFLSVFTFSFSTAISNNSEDVVIVPQQTEKESLTILTNPVKDGYLKLVFKNIHSTDLKVTIINSLGKQVYNAKRGLNSDIQTFDVSQLATGMYFLRISTTNSNFVKKLIIQ